MDAQEHLNILLANTPQDLLGDLESYDLKPGTILVQWILDSVDEYAESTLAAVAWDGDASDDGAGACFIDTENLITWLSLRWPAVAEAYVCGWLMDGEFVSSCDE